MDPEGRIRTSISDVDSDALCQLSYPGAVAEVYAAPDSVRKSLFRPRLSRPIRGLRECFAMTPDGRDLRLFRR